jgi:hypothetical protein
VVISKLRAQSIVSLPNENSAPKICNEVQIKSV